METKELELQLAQYVKTPKFGQLAQDLYTAAKCALEQEGFNVGAPDVRTFSSSTGYPYLRHRFDVRAESCETIDWEGLCNARIALVGTSHLKTTVSLQLQQKMGIRNLLLILSNCGLDLYAQCAYNRI